MIGVQVFVLDLTILVGLCWKLKLLVHWPVYFLWNKHTSLEQLGGKLSFDWSMHTCSDINKKEMNASPYCCRFWFIQVIYSRVRFFAQGNVMLNGISTTRQEWASFRQCLYSWWRDGAMAVFVQSVKRQPHFQSCLPCLKFTLVSGLNWSNCNGNHFHLLGQNLVLLSCGCTVETLNERLPSQEATLPLNHTALTLLFLALCECIPPARYPHPQPTFLKTTFLWLKGSTASGGVALH